MYIYSRDIYVKVQCEVCHNDTLKTVNIKKFETPIHDRVYFIFALYRFVHFRGALVRKI